MDSDAAVRGRRHRVWSTGRYPSLAPNLLPAIARLVSAAGVRPGDAVLDVGCGTGNAALTARRAGGDVVGVDVTRPMLALARDNAAVAGYDDISWVEGDAETLPFGDDTFDVVLSNFGHVFAPDPARATENLVRVAKPGGRVAFTAWSRDGLVGELTQALTNHVESPVTDPWEHLKWGDTDYVRQQFPEGCTLSFERRIARFRYVSPEHFWQDFAEEAGPLSPVLSNLEDESTRTAIREDALARLSEWFADNAVRVEYLQVEATVGTGD
jgi:ubiquinone/menaquinone biosynthesis C-methylase UbiE